MYQLPKYPQAKAEFILHCLYPELDAEWDATYKGTFYRNYSPDIMGYDPDTAEVELSRDGILKLLPAPFISPEDEMDASSSPARAEGIARRTAILEEAFMPFNTTLFRYSLKVEKVASEVLGAKLRFILGHIFGIWLDEITDPYVREAASVLPYVNAHKGEVSYIHTLLASITGHRIETLLDYYSLSESAASTLPRVTFNVLIPGLDAEGYKAEAERLEGLRKFVGQWLIPFDLYCDIRPKEYADTPSNQILDYNTKLN